MQKKLSTENRAFIFKMTAHPLRMDLINSMAFATVFGRMIYLGHSRDHGNTKPAMKNVKPVALPYLNAINNECPLDMECILNLSLAVANWLHHSQHGIGEFLYSPTERYPLANFMQLNKFFSEDDVCAMADPRTGELAQMWQHYLTEYVGNMVKNARNQKDEFVKSIN